MKKEGILNSEINYEIGKLGHTDFIVIGDAGLPIPKNVKRIDLAVIKNLPRFIDVLKAVKDELVIEEIIIAKEMKENNLEIFEEIKKIFELEYNKMKITEVHHEEFKILTEKSKTIIRTGECSPFANIILKSGVNF